MPDIIQQIRDTYATDKAAALNMLPELLQQYDEGLIPVLPCKVGDTVWSNRCGHPEEYHIVDIYICEFFIRFKDQSGFTFTIEDIGKTVFLTREAAEAALKERGS